MFFIIQILCQNSNLTCKHQIGLLYYYYYLLLLDKNFEIFPSNIITGSHFDRMD